MLRLQEAQDGQRDRALGDPDDVAHGLAGAVRAARVAVDVAPLHARRQVGAAQLDVVARLGSEPLPRKLELAAQGQGAMKRTHACVHARARVGFESKQTGQNSRSGRIMYLTSVTPLRIVRVELGEQ